MGNIIFNVLERPNQPPTIDNISIMGANRITRPITMDDFIITGNYQDPDGDLLGKVLIESLPSQGSLVYGASNTPVTVGQKIDANDILAKNVKYIPLDMHPVTFGGFDFRVSDNVTVDNFSGKRAFQIQIPEPPTYGYGHVASDDSYVTTPFSIKLNWNSPQMNNYTDLNLGILRQDANYLNSPIWDYSVANKIVIEGFTDDIVVSNANMPLFWNNFSYWTPLPAGFIPKQIVNSNNGQAISYPYTFNLPNGNSPIIDIGLRINFQSEELLVPTTVNSPYQSYTTAVRRLIIRYKIYSNNTAQTPTLYHMWYRVIIKN